MGRNIEQWVVAEAVGAALGGENFAVPFAFGNNRLRVVGGPNQHQDTGKMGAPVVLASQIGEQFGIVARIRFRFAGIACRVDARRAAEGGDAEAGVVGQRRQAG